MRNTPSEELLRRVYAEFSEMPGLRLTPQQARRLWGLDHEMCARVLDLLVEARFLRLTGPNTYGRLTDGRAAFPRLLAAKAHLNRSSPLATKAVG